MASAVVEMLDTKTPIKEHVENNRIHSIYKSIVITIIYKKNKQCPYATEYI